MSDLKLEAIDEWRYRIRRHGKMRTDGIIYAGRKLIEDIRSDNSPDQVANVAHLPGIVGASLAMPDIHWGYGFPIGGVAAFDLEEGVVSPGGVGYDINCGVRLMRTGLKRDTAAPELQSFIDTLYRNIPSGVGSHRKDFKLGKAAERGILIDGAQWAVAQGFGLQQDIDRIEQQGKIPGADVDAVSPRALERGREQVGTLGSGNHFVEIGYVSEVYDEDIAAKLGLALDMVTVFVHTGSRGFGYQVCDDYIKVMSRAAQKFGIELPDRQLCCAPVKSDEGKRYLAAMACAANYAFANRQMITHWVRETFGEVAGPAAAREVQLVYDVCHNIAKIEKHVVEGRERKLCVHRKGATRAFPPGHPDLPLEYRATGQPVLIPGDMGRYSYVLVGTEKAMKETFGSTCHGAGRRMSRHQAMKAARGRSIEKELSERGILIRAASRATVAEEIPEAYKDVADVVDVVHKAGIGKKVARLAPMAVLKG